MKQEYIKHYKSVLDQLENVRKEIIQNNMDSISFSGMIPEQDSKEIEYLLRLESIVLAHLDIPYQDVPGKPKFISFTIEDTEYVSLRELFHIEPPADTQKTEPAADSPVEPPAFTSSQETKQTPDEVSVQTSEESKETDEKEDTFKDAKEPEEVTEETPEETTVTEIAPESQNESQKETQQVSENPVQFPNNIMRKSDIVFETHEIAIKHGTPDSPEEIISIMCAPLKIYKYKTVSVPVVVSASIGSKRVTKSSYDDEERNIVTIDIADYSLLIRGSFDDNGVFHTIITTTDKSANQGDTIRPIEHKAYGTGHCNTRFGHPVIPYESNEGDSFFCVIPLRDLEKEDFIVISRTEEFVQYMESSSEVYGSHTATIYDHDVEKTVLPHWVDDRLEVDLL